jgi:hypothetical protein
VLYAKGCNIADQDKSGFPAAIAGKAYELLKTQISLYLSLYEHLLIPFWGGFESFLAAKQADVVVAFLGLDQTQEVSPPKKVTSSVHFLSSCD